MFKIGDFAPTGPVDPKFQVEAVAPTNHSFSQKTRLNDLSRASSVLIVDTSAVSRKFYAAANSILCKTTGLDDLSRLHLLESYCLPVLTYVVAALKLSKAQCKALNVCWNSVYRRVFKFHKWEAVKGFICGLGKLDFWHVHMKSVVRFYKKLSRSNTVIHTLYNTAVSQCYVHQFIACLLYTSPSPRDRQKSRMPSSA